MERRFNGSIALTKLKHVIRKMNNKAGEPVDVLVIPINENHLFTSDKKSVSLNFRIVLKDEPDKYNQDGFIAQRAPSEVYNNAENKEELQKSLPILGNFTDVVRLVNNSTGALPEDSLTPLPESDEGSDLPF